MPAAEASANQLLNPMCSAGVSQAAPQGGTLAHKPYFSTGVSQDVPQGGTLARNPCFSTGVSQAAPQGGALALSANMSGWMMVPQDLVTLDGSACNKIGVSQAAFRYQPVRSARRPGCRKARVQYHNPKTLCSARHGALKVGVPCACNAHYAHRTHCQRRIGAACHSLPGASHGVRRQ